MIRSLIRRASTLARDLFKRFRARFGEGVYQAGPGVALSAEDFSEAVFRRAGSAETTLVPSEVSVAGSFLLLNHFGVITIPITGYPGAAPTFRLMMHPDGERFGVTTTGRGRGRNSAAHLSPSSKTRRGEKTASRLGLVPWSPSPLCPPGRHGSAKPELPLFDRRFDLESLCHRTLHS